MMGWRQRKQGCCRGGECCFAMWVIREGSSGGSAALEDVGIGGKVVESFARLERMDARACSWMMGVDR